MDGVLTDGRRFNILVSVGTFNKGYAKKPTVRQIAVEWERRIREVKQLRDLPKLLQPAEKK